MTDIDNDTPPPPYEEIDSNRTPPPVYQCTLTPVRQTDQQIVINMHPVNLESTIVSQDFFYKD